MQSKVNTNKISKNKVSSQSNTKHNKKKFILLASGILSLLVTVPVLAAILIQNFTEFNVVVEEPAISFVPGSDADYDGDNDPSTGYLQVDIGSVLSNEDSTLPTPGTSDTEFSSQAITFTCFSGSRTYYTDVIQVINNAAEDWDITMDVANDFAGNPAVSQTFTDTNGDGGDADIWLFTSEINSTGGTVAEIPNPNNYGSLTEWYDAASPNGAIQLEVINNVLSTAAGTTGPITIPAGEQRQLGLVVDCGTNMIDEAGTGNTGTFRITTTSNPA